MSGLEHTLLAIVIHVRIQSSTRGNPQPNIEFSIETSNIQFSLFLRGTVSTTPAAGRLVLWGWARLSLADGNIVHAAGLSGFGGAMGDHHVLGVVGVPRRVAPGRAALRGHQRVLPQQARGLARGRVRAGHGGRLWSRTALQVPQRRRAGAPIPIRFLMKSHS